jgi:hypothetical protein
LNFDKIEDDEVEGSDLLDLNDKKLTKNPWKIKDAKVRETLLNYINNAKLNRRNLPEDLEEEKTSEVD